MKKNDRSNINPFTGKKHFNIVNDDKFLDECYAEYNSMINQSQLLDGSPDGKLVADVSLKLIDAVERHLLEIGRSDYTENYYDWEFHLVANDAKNATCMPGGKIMVYSGILPVTADEESLAFLLGHEMAHALLDHGRTKVSTNNAKNVATTAARLGSIGLSLLGHGEVADVVRGATTVADYGSEYFLIKPWGRGHEIEADKLGMMIIHWADYDINKVPAFWQRMSEHSSNNFDFFETHPSDNKRIDAMKKLVLEIPNQKDYQYTPVLSEKSKQKALKDENKEKNKSNLLESFNDFNIFNQNKSEGAEAITNKNVVESVLEVKEDNFCSNCGNPLSTGSSFCSKCGNKVSNTNVGIEEDSKEKQIGKAESLKEREIERLINPPTKKNFLGQTVIDLPNHEFNVNWRGETIIEPKPGILSDEEIVKYAPNSKAAKKIRKDGLFSGLF